jgi:signal peptidase I
MTTFQVTILLSLLLFVSLLLASSAPFILKTSQPFLVVMSKSMEPSLSPGDLLIVQGISDKTEEGDIVVFRQSDMLIAHRVSRLADVNGVDRIYTKGDAVLEEDSALLKDEDLLGKVVYRIKGLALPVYWLHRILGLSEINLTV